MTKHPNFPVTEAEAARAFEAMSKPQLMDYALTAVRVVAKLIDDAEFYREMALKAIELVGEQQGSKGDVGSNGAHRIDLNIKIQPELVAQDCTVTAWTGDRIQSWTKTPRLVKNPDDKAALA